MFICISFFIPARKQLYIYIYMDYYVFHKISQQKHPQTPEGRIDIETNSSLESSKKCDSTRVSPTSCKHQHSWLEILPIFPGKYNVKYGDFCHSYVSLPECTHSKLVWMPKFHDRICSSPHHGPPIITCCNLLHGGTSARNHKSFVRPSTKYWLPASNIQDMIGLLSTHAGLSKL